MADDPLARIGRARSSRAVGTTRSYRKLEGTLTVAIAVTVADGIVLAADSRTTAQIGGVHRVVSDTTNKVFEVRGRAVATFGLAFLEQRNIAAHMAEYAVVGTKSGDTVKEFAESLITYFDPKVKAAQAAGAQVQPGQIALGFVVSGYDGGVGVTYQAVLPSGTVTEMSRTDTNPGAVWQGQIDVISRLFKGLDWGLLANLAAANGLTKEFTALKPVLDRLGYNFAFDAINLQDAIDLAVLAIRSTIDVQRLTFGTIAGTPTVPGVGGSIQVLVVRSTGCEWIHRNALHGEDATLSSSSSPRKT